jgi:glycosyltransferase involved in cell wall biosynthesis
MANPAVSLVMGVYNGAEQLPDTIESVLCQTLENFEFIIVNDGSRDATVGQLLDDYRRKDSRLVVISRENAGLTRALIEGCERARGQYIARIDAGDAMLPERLAQQKMVLDTFPNCHLVTSRVEFCAPGWEPLWITPGVPERADPKNVVNGEPACGLQADIPHHGSVMFRTSAYHGVGGYRPEFYYGQDWDLWYRLAERGDFFAIPQVLYRARFFPNAISMSHAARQKAMAECSLAAHVARKQGLSEADALTRAATIRPGGEPLAGRSLTDGHYFIGEALRRNGNSACRKYFLQSLRRRPVAIKSALRLLQSFLPV